MKAREAARILRAQDIHSRRRRCYGGGVVCRRAFEVMAVTSFDRFARAVHHLVLALDGFRELGLDFVSLREAVDTSTPLGKATFAIIAAMAELESGLIAERRRAGLEYARRHGTRSGRPIGRQPCVFDRIKALELRAQGHSYREIGRRLRIPVGTLHGALRRFRSKTPGLPEPGNSVESRGSESEAAGV